MRVVVQRSLQSSVIVNEKVIGKISNGLVLLVGFTYGDDINAINYLVNKIINLRIFDDENGIMNRSLLEVNGSILSISQFTLYGDTKNGNRPSYVKAMPSKDAKELYDRFNCELRKYTNVEEGIFGEDMKVNIVNDGPTTILLESR